MTFLTINNYHYRRFKRDEIWGAVLIEKKFMKPGDNKYNIVLPNHLIVPFLKEFHNGGGHCGVSRSIETIRKDLVVERNE